LPTRLPSLFHAAFLSEEFHEKDTETVTGGFSAEIASDKKFSQEKNYLHKWRKSLLMQESLHKKKLALH
jgi:hypothetical protein